MRPVRTEATPDAFKALSRGPWFGGLDPAVQMRLIECGEIKRLRRGEFLVRQGDPVSGLYGVIDGQTRAQTTTAGGKTVLLAITHPGDWMGFLACADGRPHTMDFVANVHTAVFAAPIAAIREIFHADPKLYFALVEPQLTSQRWILEYLTDTVRLAPMQRLAARLMDLAGSPYFVAGAPHPILGLSQELIASAIMCTRQTTNELLGLLDERGLIRSVHGRIDVLNPDALKKIVREGD